MKSVSTCSSSNLSASLSTRTSTPFQQCFAQSLDPRSVSLAVSVYTGTLASTSASKFTIALTFNASPVRGCVDHRVSLHLHNCVNKCLVLPLFNPVSQCVNQYLKLNLGARVAKCVNLYNCEFVRYLVDKHLSLYFGYCITKCLRLYLFMQVSQNDNRRHNLHLSRCVAKCLNLHLCYSVGQ